MSYISPINRHVHYRGDEYSGYNFTELAFRDDQAVGVIAVIDKPNYKVNGKYPVDGEVIAKRIKNMAPLVEKYGVLYTTNIVATSDMNQVKNAIKVIERMNRFVKGFKLFTCRTTNTEEIEIIDPDQQKEFWNTISRAGYKRNVDMHLEDQTKFGPTPFDASKPITHSLYQNPEAELIQFEKQFGFAYDAGFEGLFVSLHTSSADVIELGEYLVRRHSPKFRVKFEVIWNHLLLDDSAYAIHGNFVKRNPPLRSKEIRERLLLKVLNGGAHYFASDHAPHSIERKTDKEKPASGDPVDLIYPFAVSEMRKYGVNESLLEDMLFHTANKDYFNGSLIPRLVDVEYHPEMWADYGHNSFSDIDGSNN